MQSTQDTPITAPNETSPDDPQQIGSGSAQSPGGSQAPTQDQNQMTQGQEAYPGARTGGDNDKPGQTPAAGDTDAGSTASAEATGQDGNWSATREDAGKNTGNPWNG